MPETTNAARTWLIRAGILVTLPIWGPIIGLWFALRWAETALGRAIFGQDGGF